MDLLFGPEGMRVTPIREIALAFPRGAHQEAFIEGVLEYAAKHESNWSYITAPESLSLSVLDLVGWPGDGILAALNTEKEGVCATKMAIPVVNMSSALETSPVPRSIVDNRAIGRLAAEHLLTKGFRTLAYYGLSDVQYSKDRYAGFTARLGEDGVSVVEFLSPPTFGLGGNDWLRQNRALAAWLAELPTPCGLFAVSDYRARMALDASRQIGLSIPEALAVIGVDNEQIICEHARPRLTSVARNDRLEGFRAAAMLDRLMQGLPLEENETPIPPLEIIERDSTATFAVEDSRLRDALAYIHANVSKQITIDDVLRESRVSRRWLEYAFRDVLRETPYQYLRRQRLSLAKRLLADDQGTKMQRVAQLSGFSSAKHLAIAFQKAYGVSPRDFRRGLRS